MSIFVRAVWETTTCQLAKSECKIILPSISIQVLAILASSHVWVRYNNMLLASWCNKTVRNWLIKRDSLKCFVNIVQKHTFLFKLSLVFCFGYHDSFYWNTKNLCSCPDLDCYFLIVFDWKSWMTPMKYP